MLIRPYKKGLPITCITQTRCAFDEVEVGSEAQFKDVEIDLAEKLIDQLSVAEFDASVQGRVPGSRKAAVEQKVVSGDPRRGGGSEGRSSICSRRRAARRGRGEGSASVKLPPKKVEPPAEVKESKKKKSAADPRRLADRDGPRPRAARKRRKPDGTELATRSRCELIPRSPLPSLRPSPVALRRTTRSPTDPTPVPTNDGGTVPPDGAAVPKPGRRRRPGRSAEPTECSSRSAGARSTRPAR